jgi:hypothetical protein
MAIRITYDAGAPTASVEFAIMRPLPDYDLEEVEAAVPREVDPMLASQGFKDLLDEARSILEDELEGSGLEITQLTGAICTDKKGEQTVYRPGLWLVVRETVAPAGREMSAPARGQLAAAADALSASLQIT